jgi:hypothetical protein
MKQVAFLGHIISKGGISVNPSKVQDVLSWNVPMSVGDIRSFYECRRHSEFSWISWILSKVYRRIFKDKQAYDRVAREG